jgi:hypothetical protein
VLALDRKCLMLIVAGIKKDGLLQQ